MTCPEDPAAFLRNAMNHHADHLEPHVGITESEIGKYKRRLAIADQERIELHAWRREHPDLKYHPKSDLFSYNGIIAEE